MNLINKTVETATSNSFSHAWALSTSKKVSIVNGTSLLVSVTYNGLQRVDHNHSSISMLLLRTGLQEHIENVRGSFGFATTAPKLTLAVSTG